MTKTLRHPRANGLSRWLFLKITGLWLFLVAIPLGVFHAAWVGELERETEELLRQGRQECLMELRYFTGELAPVTILHKLLEVRDTDPFHPGRNQPWIDPLVKPDFIRKDTVRELRRVMYEKTGMPPAYILLMGGDAHAGYLAPPFRGRVADGELRSAMREYYLITQARFNSEFHKEPQPDPSAKFGPSDTILRRLMDVPGPMEEQICRGFNAYSLAAQCPCLIINLPVFSRESGRMIALIQAAFLEKDMHLEGILRRLCRAVVTPGLKRNYTFLYPTNYPRFVRRNGDLVLHDLAPGKILNMTRWNPRLAELVGKGRLPILEIRKSASAVSVLTPGRRAAFNAIFACVSIFGLLALTALATREAPLSLGLRAKVALGFLVGVLMPMAGIGWMGSSYLRSETELKGEETLDEMVLELEHLDRFMRASALRQEKLITGLGRILSSKTRSIEEGKTWVKTLLDRNLLKGIHVFHRDGTDRFIWAGGRAALMNRTGELLRAPLAETMLALGAFAHLEKKALEKIQNTVLIGFSVLEKHFDMQYFGRLFAGAGQFFESPVSGTFQQMIALLPGLPKKNPETAGIAIVDLVYVYAPFFRYLEKRPHLLHRVKNGFEIHYHIYRIPTITDETLATSWPTATIPFFELAERRKSTANVFLATRTNARQNNLKGKAPHLAASRIVGMGGYLALAYAVPQPDRKAGFTPAHALLGIAVALLLAVLISRATTLFLTRPMGPFLAALQATSRGDLTWRIQLESRDEFGALGDSLNHMVTGLREKERMSRLVSEDVLAAVARDDESGIKPGGERVEATVLFSDIRSFTTISENHPPEQVVLMLNGYFTRMARCIKEQHGVLDKFIGDAVQAVFYPLEGTEPPSVRACLAALEMRRALAAFNRERESRGLFAIQTGIGLASGQVVSGCVGSSRGRLDFTVVGRTVQIAAKLETESKKARTTGIMIEPVTIRSAASKIRFGYLDRMELESGTRSVPVYELLGLREEKPEIPDVG